MLGVTGPAVSPEGLADRVEMPRAAENAAAESICRPSDDARIDDSGESVGEACVGAREGERVEFVSTAWGMRFKRPRAAGDDRRACVAAREASAV